MPTFRVDISYDGSGFRGYAAQPGQRTVQGELEEALRVLLSGEVATAVAGRTDAGVHARGQVVSFSVADDIDVERVRRSLNGMLGPEIAVRSLVEVDSDFNARFSAKWRRYRYRISTGPAPDPLERTFTWHVDRVLDLGAMRASAEVMVGEHDFSSFCRSVEGKSNVRNLTSLDLEERDELLVVWAQANAFCHQMVRSLVGHLYDVGRGFSDPDETPAVLAAGDRGKVATVAPPHGLTLWEVGYD